MSKKHWFIAAEISTIEDSMVYATTGCGETIKRKAPGALYGSRGRIQIPLEFFTDLGSIFIEEDLDCKGCISAATQRVDGTISELELKLADTNVTKDLLEANLAKFGDKN